MRWISLAGLLLLAAFPPIALPAGEPSSAPVFDPARWGEPHLEAPKGRSGHPIVITVKLLLPRRMAESLEAVAEIQGPDGAKHVIDLFPVSESLLANSFPGTMEAGKRRITIRGKGRDAQGRPWEAALDSIEYTVAEPNSTAEPAVVPSPPEPEATVDPPAEIDDETPNSLGESAIRLPLSPSGSSASESPEDTAPPTASATAPEKSAGSNPGGALVVANAMLAIGGGAVVWHVWRKRDRRPTLEERLAMAAQQARERLLGEGAPPLETRETAPGMEAVAESQPPLVGKPESDEVAKEPGMTPEPAASEAATPPAPAAEAPVEEPAEAPRPSADSPAPPVDAEESESIAEAPAPEVAEEANLEPAGVALDMTPEELARALRENRAGGPE